MAIERSKPMGGSPRKGVNTRMTDDLRSMLSSAAQANGRTVGAEIEARLLASFKGGQPNEAIRTIIREELARDRASTSLRRPCGRVVHMPCPHFPQFGHICACEGEHGILPMDRTAMGSAA